MLIELAIMWKKFSIDEGDSARMWPSLWMLKLHERSKMLFWGLLAGAIPSKEKFVERNGRNN